MNFIEAEKQMRELSFNMTFKTHYSMKKDNGYLESFEECVNRCKYMHMRNFPMLEVDIDNIFEEQVKTKLMFPSMRSLQFGGSAINKRNERMFNCGFTHLTSPDDFKDLNSLLMSGVGMGYSVQREVINQLPNIDKSPKINRVHIVDDSVLGWSDAFYQLLCSYFYGSPKPIFNFSEIRPAGSDISSGGRCPGPEPLRIALEKVDRVIRNCKSNKLSSLDVHDIVCIMADSVLAGGVRRSALIALFDPDDTDMMTCKYEKNIIGNEHRRRANNSIIELKEKVKSDISLLKRLVKHCENGYGDPGLFLTNNLYWGCNPCVEAALPPNTFCNLTTQNLNLINNLEDFKITCYGSILISTLQGAYTALKLVGSKWIKSTCNHRLSGCSLNGIAGSYIDELVYEEPEIVKTIVEDMLRVNSNTSRILGINPSDRITLIKPEGTTSTLLGSSSGINSYYAPYYIRGVTLNDINHKEIVNLLYNIFPDFIHPSDQNNSGHEHFFETVVKAPEGAITENEMTLEKNLERIGKYYEAWIKPGHRKGDNTHTVSNTIQIRNEEEWEQMPELIIKNIDKISALAMFPYKDSISREQLEEWGGQKDIPFQSISKEDYERRINLFGNNLEAITKLDILSEGTHKFAGNEVLSCIGGSCEIN
jgi:ribonucleoside-diphosphate reductase alpha chain